MRTLHESSASVKRRQTTIFLVLAAVIAVGIFIACLGSREPTYRGKSIGGLLDAAARGDKTFTNYKAAFRDMGTNSIPYIVRRVEQGHKDPAWRNKYRQWWPKFPRVLQSMLPAPKPPDPPIILGLAGSMLSSIGPSAIPHSIALLKHQNPDVREVAARSLPELIRSDRSQGKNAIPSLIEALVDTNVIVRMESASALGVIGPGASNAVPALTAALHDNVPKMGDFFHGKAVLALGRIGPAAASAVPALRSLLQNPNAYIRCQAAVSIWQITSNISDESTAVSTLMQDLPNADFNYKIMVVTALSELGPRAKETFPLLAKELDTATAYNRGVLTNAMVKIDPEAAAKLGIK